jgi:spoIIIJ-associated protein
MSQEKTTLEVIAPTVDEAIQKGLEQLGLPREAVDVEVLDTGSRGLFGLGSRQSRVRLTIQPPPVETRSAPVRVEQGLRSEPASPSKEARGEPVEEQNEEIEQPDYDAYAPGMPVVTEYGDGDLDKAHALTIAQDVVTELLDKMAVRAKVSAAWRDPEDDEDESVVLVNVEGNDLSILIGRRSETLNALQYVSSLIICKRLNHWIPIMIDVQGYRARRERQLRQLARRMAEQAIHTGRRQVLEPMPANERRLIHLELRDHPEIATESVGDEPNRKVTIFLKSQD